MKCAHSVRYIYGTTSMMLAALSKSPAHTLFKYVLRSMDITKACGPQTKVTSDYRETCRRTTARKSGNVFLYCWEQIAVEENYKDKILNTMTRTTQTWKAVYFSEGSVLNWNRGKRTELKGGKLFPILFIGCCLNMRYICNQKGGAWIQNRDPEQEIPAVTRVRLIA